MLTSCLVWLCSKLCFWTVERVGIKYLPWCVWRLRSTEYFQPMFPKCFQSTSTRLPSLKLTANAPEHRPFAPKGNESYSNHPFFRCKLAVSGRVHQLPGILQQRKHPLKKRPPETTNPWLSLRNPLENFRRSMAIGLGVSVGSEETLWCHGSQSSHF